MQKLCGKQSNQPGRICIREESHGGLHEFRTRADYVATKAEPTGKALAHLEEAAELLRGLRPYFLVGHGRDFENAMAWFDRDQALSAPTAESGDCCYKCQGPAWMPDRMLLCPTCGNKRCPKASDHELACTGSNEVNQPGSVFTSPTARRRAFGEPAPVAEAPERVAHEEARGCLDTPYGIGKLRHYVDQQERLEGKLTEARRNYDHSEKVNETYRMALELIGNEHDELKLTVDGILSDVANGGNPRIAVSKLAALRSAKPAQQEAPVGGGNG